MLQAQPDVRHQARVLSAGGQHAGAWLSVFPMTMWATARARHYQPIGKSTSRFYGVKAWNRQFDVDVANASVRALLERTVTCDRIVHDVASQLAQRGPGGRGLPPVRHMLY